MALVLEYLSVEPLVEPQFSGAQAQPRGPAGQAQAGGGAGGGGARSGGAAPPPPGILRPGASAEEYKAWAKQKYEYEQYQQQQQQQAQNGQRRFASPPPQRGPSPNLAGANRHANPNPNNNNNNNNHNNNHNAMNSSAERSTGAGSGGGGGGGGFFGRFGRKKAPTPSPRPGGQAQSSRDFTQHSSSQSNSGVFDPGMSDFDTPAAARPPQRGAGGGQARPGFSTLQPGRAPASGFRQPTRNPY
jgi:hypothetical protein